MNIEQNIDAAGGVMVYIEHNHSVTLELFSEGRRLAQLLNEPLIALFVGEIPPLRDAENYGVERLHFIHHKMQKLFDFTEISKTASRVVKRLSPSIFLMGATDEGRVLAPLIAARLLAGITADCTAFSLDKKENLVQIRPALGGNIMAHIISAETRPQCATVRPGVFKATPLPTPTQTELITEKESVFMSDTMEKIETDNKKGREERIILEQSRIVVAIGGGVSTPADIEKIREFANEIGAEFGTSRELVEKGLMPHARQVGQSGKTIAPNLYIAIGISGAVQHLVGMRDSEFVIAINSDKEAPIHGEADISIVGKWQDVLTDLIPIIKQRTSTY